MTVSLSFVFFFSAGLAQRAPRPGGGDCYYWLIDFFIAAVRNLCVFELVLSGGRDLGSPV